MKQQFNQNNILNLMDFAWFFTILLQKIKYFNALFGIYAHYVQWNFEISRFFVLDGQKNTSLKILTFKIFK